MTPVRWGILATGTIATRFVEDLNLLPDATVAAVGSRSRDSAEAFARRHGIDHAYGSWAELAADPHVDVIGEVTHVAADFGVRGPFPVGHRMRAPHLGGGALLDLGVYPIHLAHLLLGVPTSITAWASLLPEGTDANTAVVLGYASGAIATAYAGIVGESAQRAVITGTLGRVEVDPPFYCPRGFTLFAGDRPAERVTVPIRGHGLSHEAEEVMRCLRAGLLESPAIPHDTTLAVMHTLDETLHQLGITYPG